MTQVTFHHDTTVNLSGTLPAQESTAPNFTLVDTELAEKTLNDFSGKRKVLNIFPSVDTGVCATSVRKFNEKAAAAENTVVLCISADLPFAQKRFCAAEGLDNVIMLSNFRSPEFATAYGVLQENGPLKGLNARAVIVLDENNQVLYTQLVGEITDEPDYESALKAL